MFSIVLLHLISDRAVAMAVATLLSQLRLLDERIPTAVCPPRGIGRDEEQWNITQL